LPAFMPVTPVVLELALTRSAVTELPGAMKRK
jgi:hypothetical protein